MKIVGFDIITISIPMRISVEHSLAKRKEAVNVLLAARDESGCVGWGETCPRPYVSGETVDSAKADLAERILPSLVGAEFTSFEEVVAHLTTILDQRPRNQQAAFCACELALLDLAGQLFGRSAGDVVGPVKHRKVYYSGVIASEKIEKVKKYARLMKLFGFKYIKVKVGESLEHNREILRTARSILGDRRSLRVDANCAWTGSEAVRQLKALASFNLQGLEQPVSGDDLEGMKTVTAAGLVPVVADESLCSLADADTLIAERGCNTFNVRVSKCGGLINSARIYRRAVEAGITCQLGAQVGETGILSAAGRHIATRCDGIEWLEGSYGSFLLKQDITTPNVRIRYRGAGRALTAPGLGVRPIGRRLQSCQADMIVIE